MNDQASAFIIAFRSAMRQLPRYWLPVTAGPMSRRVPAYMAADVERALLIAAREAGVPDDVVDAPATAVGQQNLTEALR